jgi:catabolite regulation protein CreA
VAREKVLFRAKVSGKDASSEEDAPARAPAFVALAAASVMSTLTMTVPSPAVAGGDSSVVSEFNASGIVFKDSVQVVSLEDPVVDGVNIYLSDFKRSVSAKLSSGDLFSEPSQTSLACTRDDGASSCAATSEAKRARSCSRSGKT